MLSNGRNRFDDILRYDLCIGCGLCEAIGKKADYVMTLNEKGFYNPERRGKRNEKVEEQISAVCPSIQVHVPKFNDNVWGKINGVYNTWSTDEEVRQRGSSGGAISALCIFLLENKMVDGVLHVGKVNGDTIENQLYVSKNKNEVLRNSSSRYAPAKVFNELVDIFESSSDTFCFVGKPCDVAALKNYLNVNRQYINRISYYFAFFCAGMPSYNATSTLLKKSGQVGLPHSLKYRGDGWPGFFEARYHSGATYKVSYEESWGEVLGRNLHYRCKICPDGIGLLADIVFGDAWETKDGYPDFEEREGKSILISRTLLGDRLIEMALGQKRIVVQQITRDRISKMQPYQHERRLVVGYRILAVQFLTMFIFKLKSTGYLNLMTKYPMYNGLRNSLGTIKRFSFRKKR
jgi:coenzyme F420 hydrogenase subunit beta